ncbi:hypothetical protein OSB04_015979 [Centaurea solstitialis]|uniref:Uncharacterized protein n=1 Tax=Centaurea solstitialis TaxID=347529 RepID=A0AA38T1P0_9ASTR|nr:hypothetical protein OSB04_015979 [Centaurea solstitialis]
MSAVGGNLITGGCPSSSTTQLPSGYMISAFQQNVIRIVQVEDIFDTMQQLKVQGKEAVVTKPQGTQSSYWSLDLHAQGTLFAARRAAAFVQGDDVIHKLFAELAYRYKRTSHLPFGQVFSSISTIGLTIYRWCRDRPGGYTRVLQTRIRVGDAAPMACIEGLYHIVTLLGIDFSKDVLKVHRLGERAYESKPPAPQPAQTPLDPWTRYQLSQSFAPPKEVKLFVITVDDNQTRIEPFVTLFHGDFPQELEEKYDSCLNLKLGTEDFVHMADVCFNLFGDRVNYWIKINEPNLVTEYAYETGIFFPPRCSEPLDDCLAGNTDVEPLIRKQGVLIGLTLHCFMFETLTDSELDRNVTERAFAFNLGW